MKKNRNIFIITIIILLIIVIGIIISLKFKNNNTTSLNSKEIVNKREINYDIPEFRIEISGSYDGVINTKNLRESNVKVYEFDAGIDTGWDIKINHYIGVNLLELLNDYQMDNYLYIEFKSSDGVTIKYNKDELNDKMFLVFNRDGENMDKKDTITLLSVDNQYRYSVERVQFMNFGYATYDSKENVDSSYITDKTNNETN